jgi:hypothetical protein
VDAARFAAMFTGDKLPQIRVVLKPQIDEDEEKN